MSTTLSTQAIVTKLQQKFPIGIGTSQWMDFLNEAFRKVNQMSKGGFLWQLKTATISLPIGAQIANPLPTDFDPGKSAFLYGNAPLTPTSTLIPYKTPGDFVKEQHFTTNVGIGMFSSWTFYPNFSFGPPTNYAWTMKVAPLTAFPLGSITALPFYYHAVNFQPFTLSATVFFPTPDQFDSFIMDIAEAEARREYGAAGWDKLVSQAMQALSEMVGTYRTDRFNLAGMPDIAMQAQEKQTEGNK